MLGVDIASNLVEAGNERARERGLANCKFQEGDASNLHELKDHTFDLVVSIFGAMFAPKPLGSVQQAKQKPKQECHLPRPSCALPLRSIYTEPHNIRSRACLDGMSADGTLRSQRLIAAKSATDPYCR